MEKAYSALARVYESLIADEKYREWAEYVVRKIKSEAPSECGIDCASGSGYFTRALKRAGLDVCGVDFSAEMLSEAQRLSAKEGLKIDYYLMDMTALKGFKKVDFITVINDGINYVPRERLIKAFKSFYRALNGGGILYFDVSSEYKLKNVIGNNMFGEDSDDCAYLWFNRLGDGFVDMDLTVFTREGELFRRREESHREFIYTEKELRDGLIEAGFQCVQIAAHMGGEITPTAERLEISAKKA